MRRFVSWSNEAERVEYQARKASIDRRADEIVQAPHGDIVRVKDKVSLPARVNELVPAMTADHLLAVGYRHGDWQSLSIAVNVCDSMHDPGDVLPIGKPVALEITLPNHARLAQTACG